MTDAELNAKAAEWMGYKRVTVKDVLEGRSAMAPGLIGPTGDFRVHWNPATTIDHARALLAEAEKRGMQDAIADVLAITYDAAARAQGFSWFLLTASPRDITTAVLRAAGLLKEDE